MPFPFWSEMPSTRVPENPRPDSTEPNAVHCKMCWWHYHFSKYLAPQCITGSMVNHSLTIAHGVYGPAEIYDISRCMQMWPNVPVSIWFINSAMIRDRIPLPLLLYTLLSNHSAWFAPGVSSPGTQGALKPFKISSSNTYTAFHWPDAGCSELEGNLYIHDSQNTYSDLR